MALATVKPGTSVIDLGSGPGGLDRHLLLRGCQVTVVDQYQPVAVDDQVEVIVQDSNREIPSSRSLNTTSFFCLMSSSISNPRRLS